jgi:SNF2 family DNA or RNA helicase
MDNRPLWNHQKLGVQRAREIPNLALFFEMGCGKSRTTIEILRERYAKEKRLMRTLILGPVIVLKNWQNEFGMYSKIQPHDVVVLSGPGKRRCKTFLEYAQDPKTMTLTRGRIFITNYEAMEMDELTKLIKDWQPEILVCDESHRLKNPQSVRAKRVVELLGEHIELVGDKKVLKRKVKHVYELTGTPILNSAMDIFMQYRILDSGRTFGVNFFEFRGRFFEDLNAGMPSQKHFPKWLPRPETYEALNSRIYDKAMRVLKKDCLDLPPLVKQKVFVELGADQKRMYEEMKNEYITWVKSHENTSEPRAVVAQMALTKALRLQQIASGYAKTEDGAEVKIKNNPRLDTLGELLDELTPSHKVIIWATFHENYRQIAQLCKEKKIEYVELHGGISLTEKNRAVDRFRQDETCRVIIANQGAAGIGINLVEASYSIFYSRNFSLEHDLQAESRNYRGGSEVHKKVTRIDLVASETIDELILEALAAKQNIAEQVLGWREKL